MVVVVREGKTRERTAGIYAAALVAPSISVGAKDKICQDNATRVILRCLVQ